MTKLKRTVLFLTFAFAASPIWADTICNNAGFPFRANAGSVHVVISSDRSQITVRGMRANGVDGRYSLAYAGNSSYRLIDAETSEGDEVSIQLPLEHFVDRSYSGVIDWTSLICKDY